MDSKRGVDALYTLVDSIRLEFENNPFVNSVTLGTLTEVDLQKMTIFPMAHIILNQVTHNDYNLSFDITIVNLDIVNISKDEAIQVGDNGYYGNDNIMYIWTNQLYVINRLVAKLKQGRYNDIVIQLDGEPVSQAIKYEYENMLAGYETTLTISLPNDINKCYEV
jgi:hypothetical protein